MKHVDPVKGEPCEFCDSPGGEKTYANQVCMPISGRVVYIDYCIAKIVAALNAAGITTCASCCGHGDPIGGDIYLQDGRMLIIRHWEMKDGKIIRDDIPESSASNHQDSSLKSG